jgi:hypothetical protein
MEHIPFCSVHGGNLCSTDWPFWLLGDLGERHGGRGNHRGFVTKNGDPKTPLGGGLMVV